jgi:hypothetical protein
VLLRLDIACAWSAFSAPGRTPREQAEGAIPWVDSMLVEGLRGSMLQQEPVGNCLIVAVRMSSVAMQN